MKPAFPEITKIPYEGPSSKNSLAFKHYEPLKIIEGQTMCVLAHLPKPFE
jgi:xylose isomerase